MRQPDGSSTWVGDPSALEHLTAHERVRAALRRAILRGDLQGGSRLIQADIAASLHFSTTPVREALRDLATEGLITLDRHRGGVVRELNWVDMEEIVAIRAQLDPLSVDRVVAHATDAQIDEAEALMERMVEADDLATWVETNAAFHSVIHHASASPRLASILRTLEESSTVYVAQAQRWRPDIRRRAEEEHRDLVMALRARDREAAVAVAERHSRLTLAITDTSDGER